MLIKLEAYYGIHKYVMNEFQALFKMKNFTALEQLRSRRRLAKYAST